MDFVKRFNLTPHVEGGAFRELYRDGERAKERPAHGVIYYELGQGEASQFHTGTVGNRQRQANKIQAGAGRRR